MQAYCMKCRTKREMKDAKAITMKNGRPATQGVCPTCGTKMFRIGKAQIYRTLSTMPNGTQKRARYSRGRDAQSFFFRGNKAGTGEMFTA